MPEEEYRWHYCARAFGVVLLFCIVAAAGGALARITPESLPEVALADLPKEAQAVYALIHKGGPFGYDRDGIVFGNREGLLPESSRGYYHEYTVRTPGSSSRGTRRLICGGAKKTPDVCYYTDDHYKSFRRVRT